LAGQSFALSLNMGLGNDITKAGNLLTGLEPGKSQIPAG
jgi:hypothetical protein